MITKPIFYIEGQKDPCYNLALEQYFFERLAEGEFMLFLWQNQNTVVIGKNQCSYDECNTDLLEQEGGILVRRLSGGGAVYHDDGNINFTFIGREADYSVPRQLSVITEALKPFGIHAEATGRNDIAIDGAKFSGNAFYGRDGKRLHHGTILLRVDTEKMSRYLRPDPEKLKKHAVQSVRSRVCNLINLVPTLTVGSIQQALIDAFCRIYGGGQEFILPPEGIARAQELRAFYADPAWRYDRALPFAKKLKSFFPWGGLTLGYSLKSDAMSDVHVYSDGLDGEAIAAIPSLLEGCPTTAAAVLARLEGHLPAPLPYDISSLFAVQQNN